MMTYAGTAYPTLPATVRERLERIERLARLLDAAFVVPGTSIRVGADAIVGLAPGIGNLVTTGLSAWIIWEARQLGAPASVLARMVGNVGLDALVSAVPAVGNVVDVFFRANLRNVALLRRYLGLNSTARP